ncbi:MAG: hypothetical protein HYU28_01505, partial [Actinobacteria bacterium]|nr:hypothetical protein [Actinomycetota bacterium]
SARVFSLGTGDTDWSEEPPLATARGALSAAATEDRIVVAGGALGSGVLATTEVLTAGAEAWAPGPSMAQVREHFAMTAVGDDVYAIAGRAPDNFTSVEVLRQGATAWEAGPALNRSRGGIGAATVDRVPCVAGGEEPAGTIAPIECLRGGKWEIVAELSVPRHGLAVVALGSDLHVVSGGPQPGLTVSGEHEVFEI